MTWGEVWHLLHCSNAEYIKVPYCSENPFTFEEQALFHLQSQEIMDNSRPEPLYDQLQSMGNANYSTSMC